LTGAGVVDVDAGVDVDVDVDVGVDVDIDADDMPSDEPPCRHAAHVSPEAKTASTAESD
jgi:hypothetical protein